MKAVIPAAGLGTRMLPVTKTQPKEMLPILNKPAIHYVVEEAVKSGCNDILIITGRTKRAIEDYFDRSPELEEYLKKKGRTDLLEEIIKISEMANIMYIRQKEPLGLGNAIQIAEHFVGDEPFAILLGDDIIIDDEPATKTLIDVYSKNGDPVIGIMKVKKEAVTKYGIVKVSNMSKPPVYIVDDLVEKPPSDKAPSNLAIVGRYVLTPEIFTYLKNIKKGRGGEYQLTDALKLMAFTRRVLAFELKGTRLDIGNLKSWLLANIFMGEREGLL